MSAAGKKRIPTEAGFALATDVSMHFYATPDVDLGTRVSTALVYLCSERDTLQHELERVREQAFAEGVSHGWTEAQAAVEDGANISLIRFTPTHGRAVRALRDRAAGLIDAAPLHAAAFEAAAKFLEGHSIEGH